MSLAPELRKGLLRTFLLAIATLFVIPAATFAFTHFVLARQDASFLAYVQQRAAEDASMPADDRARALAFYQAHPLSSACAGADGATDADGRGAGFREEACARFSMRWQFHWAKVGAAVALVLGGAMLLAALALAGLANASRRLLYASFVAGWRLMTVASAVEVVLQSAMLVWLSFWVTAYFWHEYFVKLVILAGFIAVAAAFHAVYTLFKRSAKDIDIDGEAVTPDDAPRLWAAVRDAAARVGTAAPDRIVAGIDANFFVTEAPCDVQGRKVTGRTLFVSVPLLRVLDRTEADAVLAHELAHLGGGDTRSSARLGPRLRQFDEYTWRMHGGGLTRVAHYLLRLYRMIFSFALARDSREREFRADRVAAGLTAPQAIVQSLVKIAAYAHYRGEVERRLFAHDRQHGATLGISGFVADGLHPYALSPDFVATMRTASVPHPYDTHPPLRERMRNVGHAVDEAAYGAVVTAVPASTWVDDMPGADALEARLWSAYERQFNEAHLRSLAYRYVPSNDEELAVVLQFFPPLVFDLGKDRHITVSHAALHADADGGQPIPWDRVERMVFKQGSFGNTAVVTQVDPATRKSRDVKIKLRGLGKQEARFKAAVNHYWHRHQVMRAQARHPS